MHVHDHMIFEVQGRPLLCRGEAHCVQLASLTPSPTAFILIVHFSVDHDVESAAGSLLLPLFPPLYQDTHTHSHKQGSSHRADAAELLNRRMMTVNWFMWGEL